MESDTAIVSAKVEVVAGAPELFCVNQKVLGAGSDNDINGDASVVQPFGLGIHRRGAETSSYEYVFLSFQLLLTHFHECRGVAERSDYVAEELSFLLGDDRCGGGTDELGDDGNRSSLTVVVADCQWNSFALLIRQDDQELPGFSRLGNSWR